MIVYLVLRNSMRDNITLNVVKVLIDQNIHENLELEFPSSSELIWQEILTGSPVGVQQMDKPGNSNFT